MLPMQNTPSGNWFAIQTEKQKAISFNKKIEFTKVEKFDFRISNTHFKP